MPAGPATPSATAAVTDTADRYHALRMAANPLAATHHGLPEHRDRLPDLTAAGSAAHRRDLRALQDEVAAVDPQALDVGGRLDRRILLHGITDDLAGLDADWVGMGVDAFPNGAQVQPMRVISRTPVTDGDEAADLHARLAGMRAYLQDALQRHRDALAAGRPPVHRGVAAAIAQCRSIAEQPTGQALLLDPLRTYGDGAALQHGARLWDEVVSPALREYAEGLARDVEPHARPDDRPGLSWLDGGADLYRRALASHTSLADPDPDEIHATGLRVIEGLALEYAEIGGRHLGLTQVADIRHRLHTDPRLHYADPSDIVRHAQELCDRAAGAVGEVIGRLPSTPCLVRAIPEVEAHGAAAAYYQAPAPGRPHGTYWVNTVDPVLPLAESESTAFHEAWPGHHAQLALQVELDLPDFRRIGSRFSGFLEGWALYAERVSREIGLYSGDLGLLGMLATDSMRACRLVVDTGLHHMGWSRQQAIDFMAAHSPLPADSVRAEIDRYIVWPGQACSYMLGRLEIERLRADAQTRLGGAFDRKAFHDVVLGQGCLPLGVLVEQVDRWVAGQAPAEVGADPDVSPQPRATAG